MKYFCCLCEAETGELREGHRNPAGGVPLCASHNASTYWQSRQPKPPQVVRLPLSGDERYIQACILSALDGAGSSPLADIAGK